MEAQRINSLGASIDVASGMDNQTQLRLPVLAGGAQREEFYSIFPAVTLDSTGARTMLNATYAFGWNRFGGEQGTEATTHVGTLGFSRQVGARSALSFQDSYSRTNDIQTFYALRGVQQLAEDIVFVFSPIQANQSFTTNHANVGFSHALSERSSLSFSGDHTLRTYNTPDVRSALTDQQVTSGNAGYTRRLKERLGWTIQYTGTYFTFDNYNNAFSNVVRTGIMYDFAPGATASFSVGPSHVKDLTTNETNFGYDLNAALQKKIKENTFQLAYSEADATVTGVGSLSQTRSVTLAFFRNLSSRVNVSVDGTGFDSKGILDNSYDTRGFFSSAHLGFQLTRKLSVQGGVQAQRYTRPSPYDATQKRLFVSLHYAHPNLLRWR